MTTTSTGSGGRLPDEIGADSAKRLYKIFDRSVDEIGWNEFRLYGHLKKHYGVAQVAGSRVLTFYQLSQSQVSLLLQELDYRLALGTEEDAKLHGPDEVIKRYNETLGAAGETVDDVSVPW